MSIPISSRPQCLPNSCPCSSNSFMQDQNVLGMLRTKTISQMNFVCKGGFSSPLIADVKSEDIQTTVYSSTETAGLLTNEVLVDFLLRGDATFSQAGLLHSEIIELGLELSLFENNLLIGMYGKLGALEDARFIFQTMRYHDVASWNVIMSAYMHAGCYYEVLKLFEEMEMENLLPDRITLKVVLRSCAQLRMIEIGMHIHNLIIAVGLQSETSLGGTLVHMYGKCGALAEARFVFDSMPLLDEYLWTVMILAYSKQGNYSDTLQLYNQMSHERVFANKTVFLAALESCKNLDDLSEGEKIHKHIDQSHLSSDVDLANELIKLYGKVNALAQSQSLFDAIQVKNTDSYNAMIGACLNSDCHEKVLELFHQMIGEGIKPDVVTYSSMALLCASTGLLADGREIHTYIVKDGVDANPILQTALVNMYGKCGGFEEAYLLFEQTKERNVVTWNALISSLARHERPHDAIQLFKRMQKDGTFPVKATFSSILPACASIGTLEEGRMIHSIIVKIGLESDSVVSSALMHMYGKSGALEDAWFVFCRIEHDNVIHWTTMIALYAQQGNETEAIKLFKQMYNEEIEPNNFTYATVLNACTSLGILKEGHLIHSAIIVSGLEKDPGLENALLQMYSKCGASEDAHLLFESMSSMQLVSFNILLSAHSQENNVDAAVSVFEKMLKEKMVPCEISFIHIINACMQPEALDKGRAIHILVVQRGLDMSVAIATSLINMYGKSNNMEEARCVFDGIEVHSVVSWTAMTTAYVQQGYCHACIQLYHKMKSEGFEPNAITLVNVLGAYANLGIMAENEVIQDCCKHEFELDVKLNNAMINMYGKSGNIGKARSIFERMTVRTVASWNTIISIYEQNGFGSFALKLLERMCQERVSPDEMTWIHCLRVCACIGARDKGKFIHKCIVASGYESNTYLGNALVNMYGKFGALEDAFLVFRSIIRDVVSWNAILSVYAQLGQANRAVHMFEEMVLDGIKPDRVTFICLLTACSNEGLVDEGSALFISMTEDYGITPEVEHYGCLVDLLGKSGHLSAAEDLIYSIPISVTTLMWTSLLSSCGKHGDIKRAERVLNYVSQLDPQNGGPYVLLSNIYALNGMWDDVKRLRDLMQERGIRKRPGYSMIEVDKKMYTFFPRDKRHVHSKLIYMKLQDLNRQLEERGYMPDTRLVLHDVDDKMKKRFLCQHSERLALSFGLIKGSSKTPLLIVKNLRMCENCHSAFKFYSVIVNREIHVRDANRFHCFKRGLCSCGDFW